MAPYPGMLCNDHARGNTPRYRGLQRPRTACEECWEIYRARGTIEDLARFRLLDDDARARVLLGHAGWTVVCWDLEVTHLKPNVGRVLCCSFKPLGRRPYTLHALERRFRRADVFDDGALVRAIRDELLRYDIIVGWNSKMFDARFLNSRLLRAGEKIKPAQYHVDGMWAWRSKLNAWSGLDSAQRFLNPGGPEKTHIAWEQWGRALGWDAALRRKAMGEIVEHCERDVIVLEDVYRRLTTAGAIRGLRRDGGIL